MSTASCAWLSVYLVSFSDSQLVHCVSHARLFGDSYRRTESASRSADGFPAVTICQLGHWHSVQSISGPNHPISVGTTTYLFHWPPEMPLTFLAIDLTRGLAPSSDITASHADVPLGRPSRLHSSCA